MQVSTFCTAAAAGTLGILSLFATPKAEAATCPSAPPQTAQRGAPFVVISEAVGFPTAFYYSITKPSSNLNILNPTTSFLPGTVRETKVGPLYGFSGGNVTSYTSFFVLPNANPSQGRVNIAIYDILARKICEGGFDVTVQ